MSGIGDAYRRSAPRVLVIVGPAGTGKTSMVLGAERAGDGFFWIDGALRRSTWDGYRGQSTLVIDGFNPALSDPVAFARTVLAPGRVALRPRRARVLNRFARWSCVIITSNVPPEHWWPSSRQRPPVA